MIALILANTIIYKVEKILTTVSNRAIFCEDPLCKIAPISLPDGCWEKFSSEEVGHAEAARRAQLPRHGQTGPDTRTTLKQLMTILF